MIDRSDFRLNAYAILFGFTYRPRSDTQNAVQPNTFELNRMRGIPVRFTRMKNHLNSELTGIWFSALFLYSDVWNLDI